MQDQAARFLREPRHRKEDAMADKEKGMGSGNGADGPDDGVSLDVRAMHTRFRGTGQTRRIVRQLEVKGNIKASVEMGIVSISDRTHGTMVTVGIENMALVMASAYRQAREVENGCQTETSEGAADAGRR